MRKSAEVKMARLAGRKNALPLVSTTVALVGFIKITGRKTLVTDGAQVVEEG